MTVAFVTLGCKLNYAESATFARAFKAAGLEVVPWSRGADLFVVNTCSVTATSDSKSRSAIRKLHRIRPDAPIVVTGCYAQLRREEVAAIEGVALVFGADEKARLVPETLALLRTLDAGERGTVPGNCATLGNIRGGTVNEVNGGAERSEAFPGAVPLSPAQAQVFGAYSIGGRTRSFLKVQDGCDNFCAYCTVPFARGRSRNLPVCTLVRQAEEIASTGIREIVLTGVNTGDFGRTTGESFLDLLKALNAVEGIERYRISSIEPNLLTDDIIDWIASGTKVLPHFHLPLQSGSDTLLRRVGRRYDTALFASRIDKVRAAMEHPGSRKVFFGIDVIVGLPGETEELFEESYRFLSEQIRPAFLHVFPYSRRPGTRAADWPDQVQDRIKTERVARLEALSGQLHAEFVAAHKGLRAPVLWESTLKDGRMAGFTDNYIRVERPYDRTLAGTITEETI